MERRISVLCISHYTLDLNHIELEFMIYLDSYNSLEEKKELLLSEKKIQIKQETCIQNILYLNFHS